jgi:hypothetical protein
MLVSIVKQIVGLCSRHAWVIVAAAAVITAGSGLYTATHFAITTDINKLISPDLPWRQRELAFEKSFPGSFGSIWRCRAPMPELATEASAKLRLMAPSFSWSPSTRSVLCKNGLLFQPRPNCGMAQGSVAPVRSSALWPATVASRTDAALSFGCSGCKRLAKLEDLQRALTMSSDTIDQVMAGQPASFRTNADDRAAAASELPPLSPAGAGFLRAAKVL